MLSRRAFVVGAGGVVAAGTAGLVAAGPRRVFHELGWVSSPDHHVAASGWPIVERTLASTAMRRNATWAMAQPPTAPTGVIVCLHGRNGGLRQAFDLVHVHDVVADLGATLAVVSVDGGSHSYWHPRADGTDALSMVLDELIPAVDLELGKVLPRAVMGWSMGGYGALLVGETAPEMFRAVVAVSPALSRSYGDAADGAFDNASDFARYDVHAKRDALSSLVLRVDCGTGDPFIDGARRFVKDLSNPALGSFSAGFHDASYWRSVAPAEIETIADALAS
jgi:enterochelin esterase-like enzyme